jgi:hypothetical protein
MVRNQPLLTVGVIARRLGQPVHRIEYIILSRKIQPAGWAGHARVFADSDLSRIDGELRRIAEDRGNSLGVDVTQEQPTDGQ